jgi:hypothetical protein
MFYFEEPNGKVGKVRSQYILEQLYNITFHLLVFFAPNVRKILQLQKLSRVERRSEVCPDEYFLTLPLLLSVNVTAVV